MGHLQSYWLKMVCVFLNGCKKPKEKYAIIHENV
jgi:hypothetical protein